MSFRVLHDYGAYEGMKFMDDVEHETVDAAVKAALASGYSTPFFIVTVVNWQATGTAPANVANGDGPQG